ncbi:MAG: fructose bisphosphate aldolase [Rhodobacteraceae bacterium]|nr:fructose bisphosphate aldolase [Paracoccaceae bacterium]
MSTLTQMDQISTGQGFIAALDQSGGSSPKALAEYGISTNAYQSDAEMFTLIHEMRCRLMTAPAFDGRKIIGAILFEDTMMRQVGEISVADYLWSTRNVVPFLKIDKGLEEAQNGVQILKPIPGLDALLRRATDAGIFGTKMRSVIHSANAKGIAAIVAQQFDVAQTILEHGLIPIIEPEINIQSADKAVSETLLCDEILTQLDRLNADQSVILKLTLPEVNNSYAPLIAHQNVLRVVALSGGYTRPIANQRLRQNAGMIASFSRALLDGLSAAQTDAEFNQRLSQSIQEIYDASVAGEDASL